MPDRIGASAQTALNQCAVLLWPTSVEGNGRKWGFIHQRNLSAMKKFFGYVIVAPIVFLFTTCLVFGMTVGASDGRGQIGELQALFVGVMFGFGAAAAAGNWIAGGSSDQK